MSETAESKEGQELKLDEMPYDVLLGIMAMLDYRDLNRVQLVSKLMYLVSNDNLLWKLKLARDIRRWRMIDSKTYPKELFNQSVDKQSEFDCVSYKSIYMNACPDLITKKEILAKLEVTHQQINEMNGNCQLRDQTSQNNLTLSSLSSLMMPTAVIDQIKNFIYRSVFYSPQLGEPQVTDSTVPKLVMFGPGLETTTSCLVTHLLWKSQFKTIGMVPGRDGYGSGIKLKLFNHNPFNLTILYTNVSKVRNSNTEHSVGLNKLIVTNPDSQQFELHPQVRQACADATGFVYIVDSKHLASIRHPVHVVDNPEFPEPGNVHNLTPLDNYKLELNVLMREMNPGLPLLVLSCNADMSNPATSQPDELTCIDVIQRLELTDLRQDWQIRSCNIFQPKLKDIVLGFEWMLDKLEQNIARQ